MASITAIVAGLKALGSTVTGVNNSYDLQAFFTQRLGGDLPALVIVPDLQQLAHWKAQAMMGNAPRLDVRFDHVLLAEKLEQAADPSIIMPNLTTLIDNYFIALKAMPFLGPSSAPAAHWAPDVTCKLSATTWGKSKYHSAIFTYVLGINL